MAVEYTKANKDIHDQVWKLIGARHADLAGNLNAGEILVLFREKASKTGGQVVLGSSKKAAAMLNAAAGERWKFILELAEDQWQELNVVATTKDGEVLSKQEALLDHLLCGCRADHDEKTGKTKFYVAKPDVMAFRENVNHYGMWFPQDEDDEEEVQKDEDATDMFSSDEDE